MRPYHPLPDCQDWRLGNQYLMISRVNPTGKVIDPTFLQEFADKISRIVIKMIHYYDAIIYITEFPEDAPRTEYHTMTYQDLRSLPLQQIVNIVQFVVTQGRTSVGVFFPETPFVKIEIRGGDEFSVSVYGIQHNQKKIRILRALVEQEGLFLRPF